MLKIDSSIPIPEIKRSGVKKYPFDTMKVGDSFLFEHDYENNTIACQRIGGMAGSWVAYNNSTRKFSCRTVENGIRVWRIK